MLLYLVKRLLLGMLIVVFAVTLLFCMIHLVPGDPARILLGPRATTEMIANLSAQMGLDQPLVLRYFEWIGGMLTGDFGRSYTYSVPVIDLKIFSRRCFSSSTTSTRADLEHGRRLSEWM